MATDPQLTVELVAGDDVSPHAVWALVDGPSALSIAQFFDRNEAEDVVGHLAPGLRGGISTTASVSWATSCVPTRRPDWRGARSKARTTGPFWRVYGSADVLAAVEAAEQAYARPGPRRRRSRTVRGAPEREFSLKERQWRRNGR